MPSIFSARFGPRPGWAQRGEVSRSLAHAGVGCAVREAQGLPPGNACPGSFTSSWGQEPAGAERGAGSGGEEEVRVGSGGLGSRGRRVCRQPLGTGCIAAVWAAPKSATALSGFAGSAFQLPIFLTARHSPHQTPATGLRTLLPQTPQPGSRAPIPASAFTAGDGKEGLRPPLAHLCSEHVCTHVSMRTCVRACACM